MRVPDTVLYTERLVLRPLTPALARGLLAAPSGRGFPGPDDLDLLARTAATEDADARHTYLVEQDGRPIGTLGVAGALSPDGDQELGYRLVTPARGQGYGTEAVGALCAVLEREPGVRRLTAAVRPGNEASRRLLYRLGFLEVDGGSTGHLLFARAAPGSAPAFRRIAGRHVC